MCQHLRVEQTTDLHTLPNILQCDAVGIVGGTVTRLLKGQIATDTIGTYLQFIR